MSKIMLSDSPFIRHEFALSLLEPIVFTFETGSDHDQALIAVQSVIFHLLPLDNVSINHVWYYAHCRVDKSNLNTKQAKC